MDAILRKTGSDYLLEDVNGETLAITSGSTPGRMLSLKNCQAVERGYDLDELADKYFDQEFAWIKGVTAPYSDEDVRQIKKDFVSAARFVIGTVGAEKFSEVALDKALQQTEWPVTVATAPYTSVGIAIMDLGTDPPTIDRYIESEVVEVGFEFDKEGCLILKRR